MLPEWHCGVREELLIIDTRLHSIQPKPFALHNCSQPVHALQRWAESCSNQAVGAADVGAVELHAKFNGPAVAWDPTRLNGLAVA